MDNAENMTLESFYQDKDAIASSVSYTHLTLPTSVLV